MFITTDHSSAYGQRMQISIAAHTRGVIITPQAEAESGHPERKHSSGLPSMKRLSTWRLRSGGRTVTLTESTTGLYYGEAFFVSRIFHRRITIRHCLCSLTTLLEFALYSRPSCATYSPSPTLSVATWRANSAQPHLRPIVSAAATQSRSRSIPLNILFSTEPAPLPPLISQTLPSLTLTSVLQLSRGRSLFCVEESKFGNRTKRQHVEGCEECEECHERV
jgi:hypothetical protein